MDNAEHRRIDSETSATCTGVLSLYCLKLLSVVLHFCFELWDLGGRKYFSQRKLIRQQVTVLLAAYTAVVFFGRLVQFETDFALLLCLVQCFDDASFGEVQIRIVLINDLVNLPEVQMIRAQSPERVFPSFLARSNASIQHSSGGKHLARRQNG